MILTQDQAAAVYAAMCALNNVSAKLKASFGSVHTEGVNVFEDDAGEVNVVRVHHYEVAECERYAEQAAFAAAYGLEA